MPSKADLQSLLDKAQSRWGEYDKEERKKRAEEQKRLQQVDAELTKGRPWEEISKKTGVSLDKVREYSQQTRPDYGVGPSTLDKLGANLKGLGYNVGQAAAKPFTTVASGTARALGAGNDVQGMDASRASLQAGQDKIIQLLKDPSIPQERKDRLMNVLTEQNRELVQQAMQNVREVEGQTNPRKFAGAATEIATLPLGGAGVVGAAKAGGRAALAKAAGQTVGAGAAGGVGVELQQDDPVGVSDIASGAAIGGALGLGVDVAGAGAGALLRRSRAGKVPQGPTAAIDESRLLPEQAGQGADVITDRSRLLGPGVVDDTLAVVSRGADVNDVKRLGVIEKKIATAQKTSNITVDEARALMRERQQLILRIQNPTTPIGTEVRAIEDATAVAQQSGDRVRARALQNDKKFLEEQAIADARSAESAEVLSGKPVTAFSGVGKVKTSKLALGTEARAVKEELSKGFKDLPTFQGMNLDDQAARVVDFMDADYETAKRIAMGEIDPPAGVAPGSFYKGVEARAVREGDATLLERLATESTIPKQASLQGQQIASLAYRDPESPVTAMKSIIDARKLSPNKIPRTISPEEGDKIVSLAQEVANAKAAIASGGDRMAYGRARIAFDDYVDELKLTANKRSLKESLKHPVESTVKIAGLTKSLRASLDNSALLRQGWKILFTHPGTWVKNSAKTFSDIVKTVGGKEALNEVRADVVSRANAVNGMYKRMGVDLVGIKEEAFPTSLPGRIPVAGRLFKGSEAAYTGFVQRTRADLADKYLEIAQRSGVDLTSKRELKAIGKLVNALTGRGHMGRLEPSAEVLNNVFFSPRLLKSNIDVLTGHQFQKGVTPFVRKRAARNLLQIALGSAAALKLASEVTGGKVEWDPRSSNFGKVKIRDTRFDLTGGMGSLATLGARLATVSSKSSTTGEVTRLNSGEFGAQTTLDTVYNFFENKLSPAAAVVRDYMKGQTFDGDKPTLGTTVRDLTLPLIVANSTELIGNPRAAAALPSMIAEALGISVNTYGLESKWNSSNSQRVKDFKNKVDDKQFDAANKAFNERFTSWYDKVANRQDFWSLSQGQREKLVLSKKDALTEDVMAEQGYKQPRVKRDRSTEGLIKELKKY